MSPHSNVTAKFDPLLAVPPTVTTTFPEVAPLGTGTTMLVALQLLGVALVPLNVTVLLPWFDPKFDPAIVTDVPTTPEAGLSPEIEGVDPDPDPVTTKLTPLLDSPPTLTITFPEVAPLGTGTTMLVVLQLLGVALVPLNVTVLTPCVEPKPEPPIVTDVPTAPDVGFKLVIEGPTVKVTPLLVSPPTPTTTFPVVAPLGTGATMLVVLQLLDVALVPFNLTVLVP